MINEDKIYKDQRGACRHADIGDIENGKIDELKI